MNLSESWTYGDDPIDVVTKVPYLGVLFAANGLSNITQKKLAEQAGKAVFLLHKRLNRFKSISVSLTLDLFDKFITPILNYACEAWGFHDAPDIELLHLKFCKRIYHIDLQASNQRSPLFKPA